MACDHGNRLELGTPAVAGSHHPDAVMVGVDNVQPVVVQRDVVRKLKTVNRLGRGVTGEFEPTQPMTSRIGEVDDLAGRVNCHRKRRLRIDCRITERPARRLDEIAAVQADAGRCACRQRRVVGAAEQRPHVIGETARIRPCSQQHLAVGKKRKPADDVARPEPAEIVTVPIDALGIVLEQLITDLYVQMAVGRDLERDRPAGRARTLTAPGPQRNRCRHDGQCERRNKRMHLGVHRFHVSSAAAAQRVQSARFGHMPRLRGRRRTPYRPPACGTDSRM